MKTLLNIFGFLTFLYLNAYSQWVWSNPSVQNNDLNDFVFVTGDLVYAVGEVGTLAKSTDSGKTWQVKHVTSGFYEEFNSIAFINSSTGWICGQGGLIIKTTDGGFNWDTIFSNTTTDLRKIFITPTGSIYCVGDGGVVVYSNDGNSFVLQNSGTTLRLSSIYFTDQSKGFISSNNGLILKTTNGGANWSKLYLPTQQNVNNLFFPTASRGYAVLDSGKIFRTTNGGISWSWIGVEDTNVVTSSNLMSAFFIDDTHGWVAGKEARIFYTSNGGAKPADWKFQNVSPYWRMIYNIKFNGSQLGLAMGELGTILRTTDAGQFWSVINKGSDEILNRVWFANDKTGWIAGDRGTILKTTNGGVSWFDLPVFNYWNEKMTANINGIQFLDQQNGFAIGDSSYFSFTTNGGSVWRFYHYDSLDRMKNLTDLHFKNQYDGVLVGGYYNSNPVFLRTSNRGQSWNVYKPSDGGYKNVPTAVNMLDYYRCWASCKEGILRYSTDGGFSYRYTTPLPGYGNDYNDMYFIDDSVGWTIGKNGLLLKTTNSGLSWFKLETFTTKELTAIHFSSRDTGMIVGEIGLILFTTDGGMNWSVQQKMTNFTLSSVYMLDGKNAWITGKYGTVFKTTNGGITFVEYTNILPKYFELKQNYPNPFNGSTKIEFNLNRRLNISLKVYNIIGQEVLSLFEGEMETGNHTLIFDPASSGTVLPSGVYLIRLSSNDYSKTIKAILLK